MALRLGAAGSRRLRRRTKRPERGTELGGENQRLLPCREMAALVRLVVIDQLRIRPLGPASRSLILLAGKDAHGHRNGDALGVEKAALIFPVESRGGNSRVRQPIERDVVEDLVTRQF